MSNVYDSRLEDSQAKITQVKWCENSNYNIDIFEGGAIQVSGFYLAQSDREDFMKAIEASFRISKDQIES